MHLDVLDALGIDLEDSGACAERLVTLAGLAACRDVDVVVDCHEVVVGVAACTDPSGFLACESCSEET